MTHTALLCASGSHTAVRRRLFIRELHEVQMAGSRGNPAGWRQILRDPASFLNQFQTELFIGAYITGHRSTFVIVCCRGGTLTFSH